MIVATAGHIDHGKTLLVRSLTGIDTDRLPEEKARRISIDLGFAYAPTPDGGLIGFVDVPGHERFIRNMLAGVCGIDVAMLVVAADDGIMPQTVEHLQILDLLCVRRGLAVITKIDRVSTERAAKVEADVRTLLAGTSLADIPVSAASAVTGAGIDAVRARLFDTSRGAFGRNADERRFRFAVDRVFSVPGSGTVATGTVFSGRVRTGDRLTVSPAGIAARVRGIHIGNVVVAEAVAGSRCALNLRGADLDRERIARGDWVLDDAIHKPTARIEGRIRLLTTERRPLEHWTTVHLHLGAATTTGRISVRRSEAIAPGETRVVQIVLDRAIGALHGDRFVIRDQLSTRTLGGGIVLDPFAPAERRYTPQRRAYVEAMAAENPRDALCALVLAAPDGVDLAAFEASFGLSATAAAALYRDLDLVVLGWPERVAISQDRRTQVCAAIVAAVERCHNEDPWSPGLPVGALRERTGIRIQESTWHELLRELVASRAVIIDGAHLRRPGHVAMSNTEDEELWHRARRELERADPLPPRLKDLSKRLSVPEPVLNDLLHRKSRQGEPVKVMERRFFLRATVLRLAQAAQTTADASTAGEFTAAQFRDHCGANRKLSIQVLEYFDRIGYTHRIGDARRIMRPIEQILATGAGDGAPTS